MPSVQQIQQIWFILAILLTARKVLKPACVPAPLVLPCSAAPAAPAPAAAMHAAGEGLEGNRIIKLNVGGVRYATSVATLSLENSYFSALFSGRWQQNLTDEGEVFLDRDGELFKYVLGYLRARATCGDAVVLPEDPATRAALLQEARYYALPGLEAILEVPEGSTAFHESYKEQTSEMERYIAQQPFALVKELLFDILTGQKQLASALTPGLERGTILVSLLNAPVIGISLSVSIASDHIHLAKGVNRLKVVLPDQLLQSVYSTYYEIYLYELTRQELNNVNRVLYNLGTRAVLLRMLQEQQMFDVRMVYNRRPRPMSSSSRHAVDDPQDLFDYELVLEFHRRQPPGSPRISTH